MTASVRGTPRLSAVPASQNTAPVAEFRCLFTHDIRRKQKRWQDGYLKFHTFNSRVMVYDTSRNFLGDTYWKDSNELQEGDELTLDKGVMVEIAEAMGITQTDLTPLFEKKSPQAKPVPARLPPRPSIAATPLPRPGAQLRHKSLNTLLGSKKGPIGKSVPMRSPYEARKEKENMWAEGPAAKRQKTSHRPIEVRSSSPTRAEEPVVRKDLPLWARTSDAKKAAVASKPAQRPSTTINLDSDPDRISSGVTLPSTPPAMQTPQPRPPVTSAPVFRPEPPESNLVQTPVVPQRKIRLPRSKPVETPPRPPRSSSPPVSVSNRVSNVDFAIQAAKKPEKQPSPPPSPRPEPKAKAKATKSLRLSTGTKRGMLLCESLPAQRSRSTSVVSVDKPKKKRKTKAKEKEKEKETVGPTAFEPIPWPSDDIPVEPENKQTDDEVVFVATKERRQPTAKKTATRKKPAPFEVSPTSSPEAFDDMEIMHGLMDQELLPKEPSPARRAPRPKPTPTKDVEARPVSPLEAEPPAAPAPKSKKGAKPPAADTARSKTKPSPSVAPLQQPSKPPTPLPTHHPPLINAQPKTSTSPRIALSTGGLGRKKPKKAPSTTSTVTAPTSRAPILPPHPLTSNPNGPLMTTTELSHQLLRERPIAPEEDPIEDASQPGQGSGRGFRRVRSENDKDRRLEEGIPSSAALWEARSLPKDKDKDGDNPLVSASTSTSKSKPNTLTTTTTTSTTTKGKETGKTKGKSGLAALILKTDPRKKFQRSHSLGLDTDTATRLDGRESVESDLPSPVLDTDVGPWSTEAFDLFDWRPPGRTGGSKGGGDGEDDGEAEGEMGIGGEREDLGIGMLVDRK